MRARCPRYPTPRLAITDFGRDRTSARFKNLRSKQEPVAAEVRLTGVLSRVRATGIRS